MDYRDEEALVRTSFENARNNGNLSPRGNRSRSSTPPWDQDNTLTMPPKTIILGVWPHARSDHIEYYVRGYESLYPTAKLLLLQHSRTSTKHIETVVSTLICDEEKQRLPFQQPSVLVHLFGDDAAAQVCRLLRSYRMRTAQTLDVKSIILDSTPVIVAPDHQILRRSPVQLLVFIWILITSVFWGVNSTMSLLFSGSNGTDVRGDLHDPDLLPATAKKCYIFPENDLMFAWDSPSIDDPQCHRHDFRIRRNSIDHKQHWTSNQERYWLGVENAWDGR
ncbi:uncharacterized protein CLAFUR5_09265 [Fulvia fulva]|uniref:Uncharacterized protein n=1 Tax=Passalora fulva TaxID=5499 RepID=A0A9Q8PFH2_PASFU|nr:uncharacterized protein CLAFUR5_09265 [Fulvia fulva]UJO21531.1 hypothetical protein CLAFUR5_09265 [Fulvia fulva]